MIPPNLQALSKPTTQNRLQKGNNEHTGLIILWFLEAPKTRWWFQISFIFTPIWGNDPIWRAYFSGGLVQPPTRKTFHFSDAPFWTSSNPGRPVRPDQSLLPVWRLENSGGRDVLRDRALPQNSDCPPWKGPFWKGFFLSSSHHFSGDMLIFRGVFVFSGNKWEWLVAKEDLNEICSTIVWNIWCSIQCMIMTCLLRNIQHVHFHFWKSAKVYWKALPFKRSSVALFTDIYHAVVIFTLKVGDMITCRLQYVELVWLV